MEWALGEIKKAARSGKPIVKPRWPILTMRTPKGWTSPKEVHGQVMGDHFIFIRSHTRQQRPIRKSWLVCNSGSNPTSLMSYSKRTAMLLTRSCRFFRLINQIALVNANWSVLDIKRSNLQTRDMYAHKIYAYERHAYKRCTLVTCMPGEPRP